jgi:hypothetical protein
MIPKPTLEQFIKDWRFYSDLAEWIISQEHAPEPARQAARELLDEIAELAARGEL